MSPDPEFVVTPLPRGKPFPARPDETLLEAARRADRPLASSCGGHAVCGDCLVRVVEGAANLTPPDDEELAWRSRSKDERPGRLACTTRVLGPIFISTSYW